VPRVGLDLPDDVLDAIADAVAARVIVRLRSEDSRQTDDAWMSTRDAAEYLGLSVSSLHKLTAARKIPFEQSGSRGRCYFKRAALDEWRAAHAR
jgi:excisionase family DNA binding protein